MYRNSEEQADSHDFNLKHLVLQKFSILEKDGEPVDENLQKNSII